MSDYENKLHLVDKFLSTKSRVHDILKLSDEFINDQDINKIQSIQKIARDIIDNF